MSDLEISEDKVLELAAQVQNLLMFAGMMIEDLPYLKMIEDQSRDIASKTDALAPVIMACGGDYDEASFEADLKRRRSIALREFIQVLKDTEDERVEFKKTQDSKKDGLALLSGLGLA